MPCPRRVRNQQKSALQEFNHSLTHSLTHSLVSTAGHGGWSNLWKYCLARRRHCTVHHPQSPALQEFNHSSTHSLTRLSRQLVMAPGVIFGSEIASPAGVIVQCTTIHKHLHFKNSINHSLTHSLVSTAGHGAWSNLWE